jgi:hypothetical protein
LIDEVCEIVHRRQEQWLLSKVRVLTDGTGFLDPRDAERIDADVRSELFDLIMNVSNVEGYKGHASGISYAVDRATNMLSTRELSSASAVVPLPPIEGFNTQIGFARSIA